MIHDEICTYEVCKLAKEKGFPQDTSRWLRTAPCRNYYTRKGELNGDCIEIVQYMIANKTKDIPDDIQTVAAPTQSILQRWLREEKNVDIAIVPLYTGGYSYIVYNIHCRDNRVVNTNAGYDTYELALEDAELYVLKNLV